MQETTVLEGEEKFIIISKNGKKYTGASTNRVVVRDNLTTRQIVAWLNGHIIIDTGIIDKTEILDYSFVPIEHAKHKNILVTSFLNHNLMQVNDLLADEDKRHFCSCGGWQFFGKKDTLLMFMEHVNIVNGGLLSDRRN